MAARRGRFDPRRCVTGKRCLTFSEAQQFAKKQRRKTHRPVQSYRCDACHAWHTGERHV